MINSLQKQELDEILDILGDNLSITESQHNAAVQSYKAVGAWLTKEDSELASYNPVVSPQGSFIIGTTIQPIDPDGDIDLDIVCELNGKKASWTQKDVKELVGEQLKKHKKYESILDKEGRRCWTLKYRENSNANEKYHMDILPAVNANGFSIIQEKTFSNLMNQEIKSLELSITDKELLNYPTSTNPAEWLISNPFGYAKWFIEKAYNVNERKRKLFSINEAVKPTPKYQKDRLPLQRVVQLLKRHRDIMFKDYTDEDKMEKPISCIITTLAARAYQGEENVYEALVNVVNTMENYIQEKYSVELGKWIKWISNPVNDTENFADKWTIPGSKRQKFFYEWLDKLKRDFNSLSSVQNKSLLNESLKSSFGEAPVTKTFTDLGNRRRLMTEAGNNYADRKTGIVGAMSAGLSSLSKVKPHNFHGLE